jgi:hypothetical protein
MASSSEPSRKWGKEEEDDNESRRRQLIKEGMAPPPDEPEEVPPPLPEEALVLPPVEVTPAPTLIAEEASWAVNLFRKALDRLRRVAVHLGVLGPNDPL